ncbi:18517_t:CDS:2, partial [Acaulospora morrowiae]
GDGASTAVAAGVASYSGASSVVLGDFYLPVASSVLRFAALPWSFGGVLLRVSGLSSFQFLAAELLRRTVVGGGGDYCGVSCVVTASYRTVASMLYGGVPCCSVITSCFTAFCSGAAFRVVAFCLVAFLRRLVCSSGNISLRRRPVDAAALRCGSIRRIKWHPISAAVTSCYGGTGRM